jgi:hypothetical protein
MHHSMCVCVCVHAQKSLVHAVMTGMRYRLWFGEQHAIHQGQAYNGHKQQEERLRLENEVSDRHARCEADEFVGSRVAVCVCVCVYGPPLISQQATHV